MPVKPQFFATWSHKPGFVEACSLTLAFSAIAGILQGYPESLEVIIMEKRGSYSDQAVLSLNRYPYLLKIFFVPFLDMYYIKRLGKSKTMISVAGVTLFLLLFFFGAYSEEYIRRNSIWVITFLWFTIMIFVVVIHLGAEVWALTLFEGEMRYMGGILLCMGSYAGKAIGYNLFVLLNSPKWWNSNVFKNSSWKLEREILGHKGFVRGVSVLILGMTVYCIVLVKEKVIEGERTKTICETLKTTKEMLQVASIFKILAIFVLYQIFVFTFKKSIELKFIDYGIDRASLVNTQSAVIPIKLALMALAPFFAKKAYLIRQVLVFIFGTISGAFTLLVLVWSLSRGSEAHSGWMMVGFLLRDMNLISEQLMLSKATEVIPEEIGATAYTIFVSLCNTSQDVPSSIGLKIADLVSQAKFFQLVLASIITQLVVVCALWPLAVEVDHSKIEEFRIGEEIQEELNSIDPNLNREHESQLVE